MSLALAILCLPPAIEGDTELAILTHALICIVYVLATHCQELLGELRIIWESQFEEHVRSHVSHVCHLTAWLPY